MPVYSGDQLNIAQSANAWDKCKTSVSNSLQFLKKNTDYIAATVIPAIVMFKLLFRETLKGRRGRARDFVNLYENRKR